MIPPDQSGAFVAAMEAVLDVYKRPYDPMNPVVCIDEMPKQLILENRQEFTDSKGVVHYDTEYVRNGTTNVFMAVEPLAGKRRASVIGTKTRNDFAQFVADVTDDYPDAPCVTVVCDNLATHDAGSFYEVFPPKKAHALMEKVHFVHTPRHGSWLDMAEIELSVLSRQNFRRRIGTVEEMREELDAWLAERNAACSKIDWQFTIEDARIKLKRLYPVFS